MYIREQAQLWQASTDLVGGSYSYLGTPTAAGDTLFITDRIETVNRYYLAQVGMKWKRTAGPVNAALTGKLAFGWANERIYALGSTSLNGAPPALGGVVVQPSFPARNELEAFAFVPSFGAHVSVRLYRRLRLFGAYDLTWINRVARATNYIDRTVELTQAPISPTYTGVVGTRPAFLERDGSLFINGLTGGLSWSY